VTFNRSQKIALRAENKLGLRRVITSTNNIFCAFAQFSAAIEAAHFPAAGTAIDACAAAIFTKISMKTFEFI